MEAMVELNVSSANLAPGLSSNIAGGGKQYLAVLEPAVQSVGSE
jgi:hypothetical protein